MLNNLLHDGVDLCGCVASRRSGACEPFHNIEVVGAVERDWIAFEEVGHNDEVAICGELIGNELGVDKFMADDIGEDENGGGCVFAFWVGEVGRYCCLLLADEGNWTRLIFDTHCRQYPWSRLWLGPRA